MTRSEAMAIVIRDDKNTFEICEKVDGLQHRFAIHGHRYGGQHERFGGVQRDIFDGAHGHFERRALERAAELRLRNKRLRPRERDLTETHARRRRRRVRNPERRCLQVGTNGLLQLESGEQRAEYYLLEYGLKRGGYVPRLVQLV